MNLSFPWDAAQYFDAARREEAMKASKLAPSAGEGTALHKQHKSLKKWAPKGFYFAMKALEFLSMLLKVIDSLKDLFGNP